MTAGWYQDPDDGTGLRWWDGAAWTEHRHPHPSGPAADGPVADQMTDAVLVHVAAGPGMRKALTVASDHLRLGDEAFDLSAIDSVQWTASRSLVNGAYMGCLFTVRVRAGDRKGDVAMSPGSRDVRLDEFADAYGTVVRLLDAVVCPRIAAAMVDRLRAGETITLGPAGARVELSATGFRLKKPLSKLVPWDRVVRTELDGGRLTFLLRRDGGDEPKRHSAVPLEGADIVVVPHLLRLLQA